MKISDDHVLGVQAENEQSNVDPPFVRMHLLDGTKRSGTDTSDIGIAQFFSGMR